MRDLHGFFSSQTIFMFKVYVLKKQKEDNCCVYSKVSLRKTLSNNNNKEFIISSNCAENFSTGTYFRFAQCNGHHLISKYKAYWKCYHILTAGDIKQVYQG